VRQRCCFEPPYRCHKRACQAHGSHPLTICTTSFSPLSSCSAAREDALAAEREALRKREIEARDLLAQLDAQIQSQRESLAAAEQEQREKVESWEWEERAYEARRQAREAHDAAWHAQCDAELRAQREGVHAEDVRVSSERERLLAWECELRRTEQHVHERLERVAARERGLSDWLTPFAQAEAAQAATSEHSERSERTLERSDSIAAHEPNA
jgi:hypothetical protein